MAESSSRPELIFGLVGPLGTDLNAVGRVLQDTLAQVGYESVVHRLSKLMRDLSGEPWTLLKDGPRDEAIEAHMLAGNRLRSTLDRNDAMAMLGLIAIQEYRGNSAEGDPTKPLPRFAHILNSLKRPEEVKGSPEHIRAGSCCTCGLCTTAETVDRSRAHHCCFQAQQSVW